MALKNLYEEVKNENPRNISWYIGIYLAWVLVTAFYIALIWLGWNYIAHIFGLIKLTYIQTVIITIWLIFIKHIFSTKDIK